MSVYRDGGVTLANAIGTGVADDKSTYTYVPEMVRFYLGEEPILSNVPTYKLSVEDDRKYALDHLQELVVKEVQGSGGYGMLVGPAASKAQIEEFRARILANPDNYIAQPTLALSTCPTLRGTGHGAAPYRSAAVRAFGQDRDASAWRIVPGRPARRFAGGQFLAGRRHQGYLGTGRGPAMLSRTADHLYWMARYIERAENMARVLDVTYRMSLVSNAAQNETSLWQPPVLIADDVEAFERDYGDYNAANVMRYMALDDRNPSSIVNCLGSARENARSVRVAMSSEMWETVNTLWLELRQRIGQGLSEADISDFCEWVKSRSHLFRGVTFGTMLRDDAYKFVRLGTFVERADNTARLLDAKYHLLLSSSQEHDGPVDYYEWSSLLRSVSSSRPIKRSSATPSSRGRWPSCWCCATICRVRCMPATTSLRPSWSSFAPCADGNVCAWRARSMRGCTSPAWRIFSTAACMGFCRISSSTTTAWAGKSSTLS